MSDYYDDWCFSEGDSDDSMTRPVSNAVKNDPKDVAEDDLYYAAVNGNLPALKEALNNNFGLKVDTPLKNGWSTLMHAASLSHPELVEYILDQGANPNKTFKSLSPLMVASSSCNIRAPECINLLLKHGALINTADFYKETPLMKAVDQGADLAVEALLPTANINLKDNRGWTAAFYAVRSGHDAILSRLIESGVQLDTVNFDGQTLLGYAEEKDHTECLNILRDHLNPSQDDDEGIGNELKEYMITWKDLFPGSTTPEASAYAYEIPGLLRGMQCEGLIPLFRDMSLEGFLELDEASLLRRGVHLPYERRRILYGLHNFHKHDWKLNSVSGLDANKQKQFVSVDCLTALGSHVQHLTVMVSNLKFARGNYKDKKEKAAEMVIVCEKLAKEIRKVRAEVRAMIEHIKKVNEGNRVPCDLITADSPRPHSTLRRHLLTAMAVALLGGILVKRNTLMPLIMNVIRR